MHSSMKWLKIRNTMISDDLSEIPSDLLHYSRNQSLEKNMQKYMQSLLKSYTEKLIFGCESKQDFQTWISLIKAHIP